MLIAERETQIMTAVNQAGSVTVRKLADLCGVTEVTIRRDLQRLEQQARLKRTHGGAVKTSASNSLNALNDDAHENQHEVRSDALILAPIQHRAAHALKTRALRNDIPLLAESAAQDDAIYLGPDNFAAAEQLGRWTASHLKTYFDTPSKLVVLDISQALPNTQARSSGFCVGLNAGLKLADESELADDVGLERISMDGGGLYSESYQRAHDAFTLHPDINIMFGVNDDSVLAGLQAYADLGRDPSRLLAVNVGGEGDTILEILSRGGPLQATMALFPERVGQLAVATIINLWAGGAISDDVITPHALLTAERLADYYVKPDKTAGTTKANADVTELAHKPSQHLHTRHWQLGEAAFPRLELSPFAQETARGKRISFVIQYRTHEWYASLAAAMHDFAQACGVEAVAIDVNDDFKAEIRELRRVIGKVAASYVEDGDTIILDAGSTTKSMAQFLHDKKNLTVITNSLDVFKELQAHPTLDLKLTGGDFYAPAQSFVGRGAQLLLAEVRPDKAFLVAAGISQDFGISSVNAAEAEVRRSMMAASKEVVLLADHTVLEFDANMRVGALTDAHTLITDAGVKPSQRLELRQLGLNVIVAGQLSPT
ncbi:MAG: DeoR family transcriptional regulator [Deinococcota bacterium]